MFKFPFEKRVGILSLVNGRFYKVNGIFFHINRNNGVRKTCSAQIAKILKTLFAVEISFKAFVTQVKNGNLWRQAVFQFPVLLLPHIPHPGGIE